MITVFMATGNAEADSVNSSVSQGIGLVIQGILEIVAPFMGAVLVIAFIFLGLRTLFTRSRR